MKGAARDAGVSLGLVFSPTCTCRLQNPPSSQSKSGRWPGTTGGMLENFKGQELRCCKIPSEKYTAGRQCQPIDVDFRIRRTASTCWSSRTRSVSELPSRRRPNLNPGSQEWKRKEAGQGTATRSRAGVIHLCQLHPGTPASRHPH